ncbi:MAG TPA: ABC transporter substrate-binding protein [Candidatus Binatia bacterium]|nr:ABC transporter substrate-binding protein [Candidatus Binatia bacterium]
MMTLLVVLPASAQAQARIPRVGLLLPEMGRSESESIKGIRDELKQIGYHERKTILFETRNAKGDRAALQPAAMDLVNGKVDVIFVTGTRATQVAKSAARDIPIVFIHPADPVSLGLVKSTTHPGGHLTGVAGLALQMTEKRLTLSKEIIPGLQRIYIFYDPNDKFSRENFLFAEEAAKKWGLQVIEHGVKSSEELKATLGGLQIGKGDALFHVPDNLVESEADFVFDTARQKKLPTMFNEETWAIKGAMAAYGPSYYQMGRQAGRLVDMILKGRKPETIAIQRAAKFDLILNYRTATFIGLTFDRELLKRADKVIR